MDSSERSVPAALASSRVWLKWAAVIVVVGLTLAAAAVFVVLSNVSNWAKQKIIDTAKDQGVVLQLSEVDVSFTLLRLRDARAQLEGVDGITAYLKDVDVGITGFKPNSIQVQGLIVQTVGPPLALRRAFLSWQDRHEPAASLNVPPKPQIKNIKITWQETLGTPPFLQLEDVTLSAIEQPYRPIGQDIALRAERAQVGSFSIAPLLLALHNEADSIEIGLGANRWEGLTVRGGWMNRPDADELHVSFGPVELGPWLAKTGLRIKDRSLAAASLYGGLSALIPRNEQLPYQGNLAVDVQGWTPPHPEELQGFPFGNSTKFETSFEIDRALTSAMFTKTRITSGEFRLKGQAIARRNSLLSASVQGELKGHIPCTALAGAVAESKLGKAYGAWVGRNAGQIVQGNVEITLQVDADSRFVSQAKVVKQIGIGCGLRPLTVRDLLTLGLPPVPDADLLTHIGQDLPHLGALLPPVPSIHLPDLLPPDLMKPRAH